MEKFKEGNGVGGGVRFGSHGSSPLTFKVADFNTGICHVPYVSSVILMNACTFAQEMPCADNALKLSRTWPVLGNLFV